MAKPKKIPGYTPPNSGSYDPQAWATSKLGVSARTGKAGQQQMSGMFPTAQSLATINKSLPQSAADQGLDLNPNKGLNQPAPAAPVGPSPLAPRDLQSKLNSMGAGLAVDGQVGPKTRAAMARYGMDAFGNVTAPSTPAPSAPDPSLDSQNVAGSAATSQPTDFSGLLSQLQGAQGADQAGPSITDQLMQQLGPAPELPTFDVNQVAQNQIAGQFIPQEQALKNALTSLNQQYAQGQNQQQIYGQKATQATGDIFNALQNTLGQGESRTANIYGQAQQASQQGYQDAAAALKSLNQDVTGQMQQSAGGLNLQQAMPLPMSQIENNYQRMAGSNISNQAIAQNSLGQGLANTMGFQEEQRTGAARQGAQAQSDVTANVQNALAQLGLQQAQGVQGNQQQQTTLAMEKGPALQNAIYNLNQLQYQQQIAAQNQRLQELLGFGNIDVRSQRNDVAAQKNQVALQDTVMKLMEQQQTAQSNFDIKQQLANQAKPNADIANALKLAQIQNYGLTGAKTQAQTNQITNPQPKNTAPYANLMQDFMTTPQQGLWGTHAGPLFTGMVNNLVNAANTQKGAGGNYDPYQFALAQIPLQPDIAKHHLDIPAIQQALRLYYKGGK